MQFAQRLYPLEHNVFADMDEAKAKAQAKGLDIIDLSLGSSDLPTSAPVLETIAQSLQDPFTHRYLLFHGTRDFRIAAAQWYQKRYSVTVDPETEVLPLIGCQEGTGHLPLAILNPGDFALLLDPGYPSHAGGVYLAGGQIYAMPILAENQFLPVFADIPPAVLEQAKMMVLSYPHNPTSAIAPLSFFQEAVSFCQANDLVLVHDFPYFDVYFEGMSMPPSILQADPEKSVSIEFFTFSKSYNMGGFRIGFAVGNRQLIQGLKRVKSVIDFNQYLGILRGAITALEGDQSGVKETVKTYQQRRDGFIKALDDIGWKVPTPIATSYIWAKLPEPWQANSVDFCCQLVAKTGVAASPGAGFGKSGEGYVRFALVHDIDRLREAVGRIGDFLDGRFGSDK
ncbi:MAG: LL-diaminopimelate aminotransferase [Microcystaceae cyanobacterium]